MKLSTAAYTTQPEIRLADRLLRHFPEATRIYASELERFFDWTNPAERTLYRGYYEAALEVLIDEGYVRRYPGGAADADRPKFGLTQAGRELQRTGGFMQAYLERKKNDAFAKKVVRADGENKRLVNRMKYIAAFVLILGGLATLLSLLGKFVAGPAIVRPPVSTHTATDSAASRSKDQAAQNAAATRRHHPKTVVAETPHSGKNSAGDAAAGDAPATKPQGEVKPVPQEEKPVLQTEQKTQPATVITPPAPARPLQSTVSDNIEFKLLKAEGNTKTQSITMTMVLTTTAANWYIMSSVKSIIDNDGNEYKLKSFTIGSNNYFPKVELTTGVPIRCTYTFGGVLPGVRFVKLFKYDYTHQWGQPFSVEFRDIPVDWR